MSVTSEPQRENKLNTQPEGTTCEDCQRFEKSDCPYPGSNITMIMCNSFLFDIKQHDAALRAQWEQEHTKHVPSVSRNKEGDLTLTYNYAALTEHDNAIRAEERERVLDEEIAMFAAFEDQKRFAYSASDIVEYLKNFKKLQSLRTAPTTTSQPGGDEG